MISTDWSMIGVSGVFLQYCVAIEDALVDPEQEPCRHLSKYSTIHIASLVPRFNTLLTRFVSRFNTVV